MIKVFIRLINNLAQIKNINYNSKSIEAVSNAFAYLWGGDPTLEIWTDNISTFSNITVNRQERSVSVNTNGVSDCTITAVDLNNVASSAYFSCVKGQSYAEFSNVTFPCYITVSRHNYVPYILYVTDQDIYIQNEIISKNQVKYGQNIYIGSDVTTGKTSGKVIVQPDAEVQLKGSNSIYIKNDFEIKKGATLRIDTGN